MMFDKVMLMLLRSCFISSFRWELPPVLVLFIRLGRLNFTVCQHLLGERAHGELHSNGMNWKMEKELKNTERFVRDR